MTATDRMETSRLETEQADLLAAIGLAAAARTAAREALELVSPRTTEWASAFERLAMQDARLKGLRKDLHVNEQRTDEMRAEERKAEWWK